MRSFTTLNLVSAETNASASRRRAIAAMTELAFLQRQRLVEQIGLGAGFKS